MNRNPHSDSPAPMLGDRFDAPPAAVPLTGKRRRPPLSFRLRVALRHPIRAIRLAVADYRLTVALDRIAELDRFVAALAEESKVAHERASVAQARLYELKTGTRLYRPGFGIATHGGPSRADRIAAAAAIREQVRDRVACRAIDSNRASPVPSASYLESVRKVSKVVAAGMTGELTEADRYVTRIGPPLDPGVVTPFARPARGDK